LWSGAPFDDGTVGFEDLGDWMSEVVHLNWMLFLYATLEKARSGDHEGLVRMELYRHAMYTGNLGSLARDLMRPRSSSLPLSPDDVLPADVERDEMLLLDIEDELAQRLSGRLDEKVTLRIGQVGEREWRAETPPGDFILEAEPVHLLARAHLQLALEMTEQQTSLSVCPEDGRIFPVRDPRQRYCSPRCAGRVRQRRFAERAKDRNGAAVKQQRKRSAPKRGS
jgi:hypothetical protein